VIANNRDFLSTRHSLSKEDDFMEWGHRLKIHASGLRAYPKFCINIFCIYKSGQLWTAWIFLINNAAQTVRRPAGFYHHLMSKRRKPYYFYFLQTLKKVLSRFIPVFTGELQRINLRSASPNQKHCRLLAWPESWELE